MEKFLILERIDLALEGNMRTEKKRSKVIGEWMERRRFMGHMGRGDPGEEIIWNVNKEYRK